MYIVLDKIAIWRPLGFDKLMTRPSPLGEKYQTVDSPVFKLATKPLIRYAKDYKIGKIEYSLFVRTFCEDEKAVEKALDAAAKKLDKAYVLEAVYGATMTEFKYTDFIFDEDRKDLK